MTGPAICGTHLEGDPDVASLIYDYDARREHILDEPARLLENSSIA